MTTTVETETKAKRRTYPRVPALCNVCGTQRDAAWRTIARTVRLKCATCCRTTAHAVIAPEGWGDWTEHVNLTSEDARELQQLTTFIKSRGVGIFYPTHPAGGEVEIRRYVEPIEREDGEEATDWIGLLADMPAREKVDALRWAWRYLPPIDSWDAASPIVDPYGRTYVGIYQVSDS